MKQPAEPGAVYSYSQIRCYATCPLRYRYQYLDGWREQPKRAALWFGRAFEQALGAYFSGGDAGKRWAAAWGEYRHEKLEYTAGDSWQSMLQQGQALLACFMRDHRVQVADPSHLQLRLERAVEGARFVAYLDAIGRLDGARAVLDWKTTSQRYPEAPDGLLALDPQLICYAWMSGIRRVGLVVFLRKRLPEIQYLTAEVSRRQIEDWQRLVTETVGRIEAGVFPAHSGIRFPFSPCPSCAHLGLCLNRPELVREKLVRTPQGDALDWMDELAA